MKCPAAVREPPSRLGSDRFRWDGPPYERQLPAWEPRDDGRSPVIALLDSGVIDHEQLPRSITTPFLLPRSEEPAALESFDEKVPMAYGHATFIAGMIRMGAPAARVLSVVCRARPPWPQPRRTSSCASARAE